jgi:hypothetical protein
MVSVLAVPVLGGLTAEHSEQTVTFASTAATCPLSRYSMTSREITVESMSTRMGASVSFRTWCAPSFPRGK